MRMIAIAPILLALSSTGALATGGFGCEARDAAARIEISASTTRGMGFPVLSIDGSVELKGIAFGDDLRSTRFDAWSMLQYWVEDDELRFVAYIERHAEPHAYIKLVVRTKFDERDELVGRYEIEALDMAHPTGDEDGAVRMEGEIACVLG